MHGCFIDRNRPNFKEIEAADVAMTVAVAKKAVTRHCLLANSPRRGVDRRGAARRGIARRRTARRGVARRSVALCGADLCCMRLKIRFHNRLLFEIPYGVVKRARTAVLRPMVAGGAPAGRKGQERTDRRRPTATAAGRARRRAAGSRDR